MKAITLTQPWATLVAIGAKKIETRSWSTKYRGPLAIHAGKGLAGMSETDLLAYFHTTPFAEYLFTAGYKHPGHLPRGSVIAIGVLTGVTKITATNPPSETEPEFAFGNYTPGRFAWHIDDVLQIVPVPARGSLGLWSLPDSSFPSFPSVKNPASVSPCLCG